MSDDNYDITVVKMKHKIAGELVCIPKDKDCCEYLEAIVKVKTGKIRYRCEWCETGGMRTCNYREKLETCRFDKYGNRTV